MRRTLIGVLQAALLASTLSAVSIGPSAQRAADAVPPPSTVSEFQPSLAAPLWGGRTVAIDVKPTDVNTAIAAAESGGLFRTTDGGATWTHLDDLVPFRMADVKYARVAPSIVLATASSDSGRKVNGGGIWRSTDGGTTWQKPATANPGCNPRANAWGISFEPASTRVFVATDCGVAISTDLGATWTHTPLPQGAWTVAASQGGIVDACGNDGHRRSTNAGAMFGSVNQIGGGGCPGVGVHSLAVSPIDSNVLFASTGAGMTWESDDGGATWTNLAPSTGASRPPWVSVNRSADGDPTHIDVYASGGLNTFRQTCTGTGPGLRCGTGAAWSAVTVQHADPSKVAFTPDGTNCALYLVDDGGVEKSSDCGATFTMVGGGTGGYNALQIYEVTGQAHPGHTDVYFGTQDNDIWGSQDGGATWARGSCCEGWWFQLADFTIDHTTSRQVTGERCCFDPGFHNAWKSNEHYSGIGARTQPALPFVAPFRIEDNVYLQWGQTAMNSGQFQMYISTDGTNTWNAVPGVIVQGAFPERFFVVGGPADPIVYALTRGAPADGTNDLLQILGVRTASPTVNIVDAGLTSVDNYCNGQGTFRCPPAIGVDPNNPLHLIAADKGTNEMKESLDGGQTWQVDAQLTSLVTDGGAFDFDGQVHVIQWDPSASGMILVGTEARGILASLDDGQTWAQMTGSDRIPAISTFFFDKVQGSILVSSYGRGLWKLDVPETDLRVSKTHRPDPATAGTELYYDIVATNDGPETAPAAFVTDQLPPQVTYVTNTLPDPSACSASLPSPTGQTVTCLLGDMAAGDSRSFTIKVAVNSDAVADAGHPISITNTVGVKSSGARDSDADDNTAVDTVIVEDIADLSVTKLCKPDSTVRAGEPIDCTVFVDNHGPSDARKVVVDDTMLSNGSFTVSNVSPALGSGTPGCTLTNVSGGQRLTCRLDNLAAASTTQSGRAAMTYRITTSEGQDINNVAVVRSDTPDTDASNDQATLSMTVESVADLRIEHVAAPATAIPGTDATYRVRVTNDGPSIARNARIEDTLPAGVSIVSVTPNGGSCVAGAPGDPFRPTTCGFGDLAPGASRDVTMVVRVLPDTTGITHNDARALSDTFDNDGSDDLTHADTTLTPRADLSATMAASPNPVVAGRTLTYRTTVRNAGESTATGVVLAQTLPAGVTLTGSEVPGAGGSCGLLTPTELSCALVDLDPGESLEVFAHVLVDPSVADGTVLGSTATTSSAVPDPVPGNDAAGASSTARTLADLSVELIAGDVYKPSTVIHYTVAVANAGPSDAVNVQTQVELPPAKSGYYVSNDAGCPPPVGTIFTCALGTLAAGKSASYQLNFHIRGNKGTITSTAVVSSPTGDPVSGNNTSIRNVTVK